VSTRADALSDLAVVLALGGRRDEALVALGEATRLHERKGNLAALERVRLVAAQLAAAPSSA
jgi:hypothetical protein